MKVIVLSTTKYKENDVIYNAISETESVSFKGYRAFDSKSSMMWLNNPLTIADIEFADRRYKYPTLKEAKLLSSPLTGDESLEYLYSVSSIIEITNNVLQESERHLLFKDIEAALEALNKGVDYQLVILLFLARAISFAGAELEVDHCVFCDKTSDIVTFSFPDGGFVCRKHAEEQEITSHLTPNQMKLIRYIFKAPNYSGVGSDKYSKEDRIIVLRSLKEYVQDDLGVYVNSIDQIAK